MPSLAACWCLFRLMRHCYLGWWTCLPVSERFRLVWRCHLFDYSTYIQFCVHWHGRQCLRRPVPNYVVGFRLGWVYSPVSLCHNGVVGVGNCFCGVPSASFLSQLEAVFSGLACPLVVVLIQCRSILCLHPVNVLSLWCFCRESLLLLRFLLVDLMLVGFVPSSLCEWNRGPW